MAAIYFILATLELNGHKTEHVIFTVWLLFYLFVINAVLVTTETFEL